MSFPTPVIHGVVGKFGVASAETGVIIDSIDADTKAEEKMSRAPVTAAIMGLIMYNATMDLSIKMQVLTGSATGLAAIKIGGLLTLTNTIDDHGVSSGVTVCKTAKRGRKIDDFEQLELTATQYPGIASA